MILLDSIHENSCATLEKQGDRYSILNYNGQQYLCHTKDELKAHQMWQTYEKLTNPDGVGFEEAHEDWQNELSQYIESPDYIKGPNGKLAKNDKPHVVEFEDQVVLEEYESEVDAADNDEELAQVNEKYVHFLGFAFDAKTKAV